ncbi:MAG: UbiA prenyltransferase family protein [Thermoplasmata archaeon]|nr:UbiA prenyltransferase family protein [Thermoplasmata archaeon]
MSKRVNSFKSVFHDFPRIDEWWLLSIGMILFAFIPYSVWVNDTLVWDGLCRLLDFIPLYPIIIVVFAAQWLLFAANDYFDRHVDALDKKKRLRNPVSDGRVTPRVALMSLAISVWLALVFSAILGLWPFLFTALILFVFYFYTAEPLRFKNKVGLDVVSHALSINTFPYSFAILVLGYFTLGTVYLLIVLILRSAMVQMLQEIRDHDIDKQVERNTVVVLGRKRSFWIVFSFLMAIIVLTGTLLTTYQLFGVGLPLTYLIVLFLGISYLPAFHRLLRSRGHEDDIERLWLGQGRTVRATVLRYVVSFAAYFSIMVYVFLF